MPITLEIIHITLENIHTANGYITVLYSFHFFIYVKEHDNCSKPCIESAYHDPDRRPLGK